MPQIDELERNMLCTIIPTDSRMKTIFQISKLAERDGDGNQYNINKGKFQVTYK